MENNEETEHNIQKLNDKLIECLKAFEKSPCLQNAIDGYDFKSMISNKIKKLETFRGQTLENCIENNFQDFFNSAHYEISIYQAYIYKLSKENEVRETLNNCTILLNSVSYTHLFNKRDAVLQQINELDKLTGPKTLERKNHIDEIVMKTYAVLDLERIDCYNNYVYNLRMFSIGVLVSLSAFVVAKYLL
jgi:hypothetical protein